MNTAKSVNRITEHSGLPQKARGFNLHGDYRMTLLVSLATALVIVGGLVNAPLYTGEHGGLGVVDVQEVVMMEEIKPTSQQELPPPPPRPQVPVAVPDEMVLTDDALDLDASLDLDAPLDLPMPPPPPLPEEAEDETEVFVIVEEMPQIVGGTARLYELISYPEIARQAGMEGMVVVQVIIEPNGRPSTPTVARSAGGILDEAAVAAVMKLTFQPGKQRGKAVRVKFAVPVRFRLRETPSSGG